MLEIAVCFKLNIIIIRFYVNLMVSIKLTAWGIINVLSMQVAKFQTIAESIVL